jgi:2-dehydro-3-deoxyphosphogluconate aldolase/(4S)-4-hydroxy-2-oxoglutarate aldolase
MEDMLKTIAGYGIVPVVKIDRAADAAPLGKALLAGGLPLAEITFRTAAAEEVIRILSGELPELVVGAGTVLTIAQAKTALAAGAKFIVAPGFNPRVVSFCLEQGVPVIPGVNSPTQIEAALEQGLKVLKFFPAQESGGTAFLKAVAAPYDGVSFIPTGGINAANLLSYLSLPNVLACGGSWMVKGELIAAGKFAEITALTREAIALMLGFELAHVGLNEESAESAARDAALMAEWFHMPVVEGQDSFFAGKKEFEIMKIPGRGARGHLGLYTNDFKRAIFHLGRQGIGPIPGTEQFRNGRPDFVYLDREIAGFAIHIRQKG